MKGKQRQNKIFLLVLFAVCSLLVAMVIISCVSAPASRIVELENKGTSIGVPIPEWVKLYIAGGVPAVQRLSEYRDKYCIIGEETGVNRQFVLAWADAASAQQRIGAFLRTSIASRYEAAINAAGQSGAASSPSYRQEINNVISSIVTVSFSGAMREGDWWSLRRSYDADTKEPSDSYTAWVLYTIPKSEMNRQIALAMETAVSMDSALYDITIAIARDILLQGYDEKDVQNTSAIQRTAGDSYDPPGSVVATAINEISLFEEYAIGREVAAMLLSNYKLWDGNPALINYLNSICSAIVINSPNPVSFNGYHVAVLDSDTVNAFASSGGHIFVTRGIISAAKSEDALAAVLAHEIAHIQLHHGMRAIQQSRDVEDWLNQFAFSGGQIIADRLNSGFSQVQEFDADIYALSLLAATNYSPSGLLNILQELEQLQGHRSGGFNDTHPSPASRLVNARVAAQRYANLPDTRQHRVNRFNSILARVGLAFQPSTSCLGLPVRGSALAAHILCALPPYRSAR